MPLYQLQCDFNRLQLAHKLAIYCCVSFPVWQCRRRGVTFLQCAESGFSVDTGQQVAMRGMF